MATYPNQNLLSSERVVLSIRQRFNPTKGITADALSSAHDESLRRLLPAGFVAPQSQTHEGMLLRRASPAAKIHSN
jgi:hypothetical protein